MNLNIAICDDATEGINDIYCKLKKINEDFKIDKFNSGQLLIETNNKYHIVFLDIEMNELNGIQTAEYVRQRAIADYIIFLTSYPEFMQDAFKVKAFRYLCKPAQMTELQEALSNIEEEIMANSIITINDSGNLTCVSFKDIICLEAFGDGTYIYTKDKVYTTLKSLKKWMSEIENYGFFQVHKSYIVSFEHVVNIHMYEAEMNGLKMNIPISQRKYPKFKKSFFEYVKKRAFHM